VTLDQGTSLAEFGPCREMVPIMTAHRILSPWEEAVGALPGSFPLWGRYEKFAFPNWGTKYFVDALLCAGHDMAR